MIFSWRCHRGFRSLGYWALGNWSAVLFVLERGVASFLFFGFLDGHCGAAFHLYRRTTALDALPNQFRNGFVDRAGVGLFLGDAQLGEHFEDDMRRNLELPRQLVDADFTHKSCERALSAH